MQNFVIRNEKIVKEAFVLFLNFHGIAKNIFYSYRIESSFDNRFT